jgi:hypothetical protein
MIEATIKNCEGIVVEVTSLDTEQEVSKLDGIKSYFHMSFNKVPNHYTVRTMECFCDSCTNKKYDVCSNKIGRPRSIAVEVLGDLQAPGKETKRNEKEEASQGEEYVVERICGSRKYRGDVEYLVKWKGYEEEWNSWIKLQNLNCPRLIAQFNNKSTQ